MKYIKIQNKGLLSTQFFSLMGYSSKANDPTKIGEHGTGLKYAVSYFLRHKIEFKLFVGKKEIKFEVKPIAVGKDTVDVIHINNKATPIGTNYGKQWAAWEAVREIYCNALDEEETLLVKEYEDELVGEHDRTTFYIPHVDQIEKVLENWHLYFLTGETPIFENEKYCVYHNIGKEADTNLRIYKQGILVENVSYRHSPYSYDIKQCPLNELRQYRGNHSSDIADAILNSNEALVVDFLTKCNNGLGNKFENSLTWSYATLQPVNYKLWNNYVYLHKESSRVDTAKGNYKVPNELLDMFTELNFVVERYTQSDEYYGRGSYGNSRRSSPVRLVKNVPLAERIIELLKEIKLYKPQPKQFEFSIGIRFDGESFDYVRAPKSNNTSTMHTVFSNELQNFADEEIKMLLEIVVNVDLGYDMFSQLYDLKLGKPFPEDGEFDREDIVALQAKDEEDW